MSNYAWRLAVAVKKCRTELDLTQEELAEKSGTDVRTIIAFEKGRGNPKLETLYSVVRALKMDARQLFDDEPHLDSPSIRQLNSIINNCSEEEAATILSIVNAVLVALRSNDGQKIE